MKSIRDFLREGPTAIHHSTPEPLLIQDPDLIEKINEDLELLTVEFHPNPHAGIEVVRKYLAKYFITFPGVAELKDEDEEVFPVDQYGQETEYYIYVGWMTSGLGYEMMARICTEEEIQNLFRD